MNTIIKPIPIQVDVGRVYATMNAMASLEAEDVVNCLVRHLSGDWGEVDEHDQMANDLALDCCHRILSVYTDRHGVRFWIITEADRSRTTILLPMDY